VTRTELAGLDLESFDVQGRDRRVPRAARDRRTLPSRYGPRWREPFDTNVQRHLRPGVRVLDLGAGAAPVIPAHARPTGCTYIGLDIDRDELEKAPRGSYDGAIVGDASEFTSRLEGQFDLVVSWQALEHVPSFQSALDNCYRYLRPRGAFVALFSGRFATFAIINRLIPEKIGAVAMQRLLGRDPETMFSAHYDRTYYTALVPLLEKWSRWELIPLYLGAGYFAFNGFLQQAYVAFENWAARGKRVDLATYYVLAAER
jgi:SAM-dependent methyltransferase